MDLREYRESEGWTLAQLAERLGLQASSKAMISRLERGEERWPIRLALEVEVLSRGQVRALDLVGSADRLLLESAIARGASQMEAAE